MWISILSMTEHYPTIWDDLVLPTGIDKTDLVDRICIDCAELELLYTDPNILKYMIRNWSRTEQVVWTKMLATTNLVYNPIWNLDVKDVVERVPDITKERTPDITKERTPDLTETQTPNTTTTETPTDTTTEAVIGYNATTWSDANKTTRGGNITTTETGTDTLTTTGSDTYTETGTETFTESGKETTTTTRQGNQGVTSTQQMIKEERDVSLFNIYQFIEDSFKSRFCILIY